MRTLGFKRKRKLSILVRQRKEMGDMLLTQVAAESSGKQPKRQLETRQT